MTQIGEKEREELEMLMPWYVNGTLDRESVERIEAALKVDASLSRSLMLLKQDRDAAVALAEADELPESMEARFLAQLDAEPANRAAAAGRSAPAGAGLVSGFGTWIGEFLAAMTPGRLALAAAAACVVVLLQTGIIVSMLGTGARPGDGFRVASGDEERGGPALLVQFTDEAGLGEITAFLEQSGARIVDGPLPGGLFKLRFDSSQQKEIDELVELLRGRPEYFRLVLPGR